MKCCQRSWRPRLAPTASPLGPLPAFRGALRSILLAPAPAVKSPGSNAPLSLSDIIAFESHASVVVLEPAPPEQKVDQLINRASRVLQEVNSVLLSDQEQQVGGGEAGRGRGRAATATATATLPRPEDDPAGAGLDGGSELSRAIFGGSAQVSEREAALKRQALQKSLEGGSARSGGILLFGDQTGSSETSTTPTSSTDGATSPAAAPSRSPSTTAKSRPGGGTGGTSSGGGISSSGSSGGVAVGASEEPQQRPAWAQALFASSSTAAPSTASASTAKPGGSSASRSPAAGTSAGAPSSSSSSRPATSSSPSAWAPSSSSSGPGAGAAPGAAPPEPLRAAPAPARRLAAWSPLAYAEVDLSVPTELTLKSEETLFAEAARAAVLPPLQSVVDLTAAVRPPTRGLDLGSAATAVLDAVSDAVSVSEEEVVQGGALGRRLADGAGRLADGTRFEKLSGTDTGPHGYVKKWEVLRGITGDGRVQWEECWWQASNRYGLRELGAFKKGTTESGASWVEEWKEVLRTHPTNLRLDIERTAHKWARDENADEWEEKWGECFEEAGRVHKWADKWAKAGSNVWHERWGEDYDGRGACQKWTDKWAERLLPDGGQEQWGDKWTETFGAGRGTKHGEVWSSSSGGSRYNRWWNEEHFGDGRVRKWGNSNGGEYWDTVEHMDTYYNPVPHFGFQHAVGHSPQLWAVPLPAPDEGDGTGEEDDDGLGVGLGRL